MLSFQKRLKLGQVDIHHHHAEYQPIIDPEDEENLLSHDHDHDHD